MKAYSSFFYKTNPTWQEAAKVRRFWMFISVFLIECVTVYWFSSNLSDQFPWLLKALITLPFSILLFWLQLGFFTALAGLWVGFRHNRFSVLPDAERQVELSGKESETTAILLPVYNEEVAYVYAGLKSMYQSLKDKGALHHFEFYILSDSNDASIRLQEGAAWLSLCDELDAHGRIHYRQRKHRKKKKSGNVMDFCRRWGKRHPYMIVLDADSLMSGDTLVRMVDAMDQHPKVALIQSPLYTSGVSTIFSRYFQFLNRLYGPVFFAGLHWWWLGESQYWGHNVIMRTQAFMDHCDLPKLERGGQLDGDILSHDFVEAALLNRAGWETWLAFDLDSIERPPPTLTDALKRDRRWCQGNLQHWHVIWSKGITHMQRFLMLGGILSYATSAVWLVWLLFLTYAAVVYPETSVIPNTDGVVALTIFSLALLFFYKLFGVFQALKSKTIQGFGGFINANIGIIAESIFSMLITSVKMLYYTRFMVEILAGKKTAWVTQQRSGRRLSWRESWQEYRWVVSIGFVWSLILVYFNPIVFFWMLPVLIGMWLVIPIAVYSSMPMSNQSALFKIPDEDKSPDVLVYFDRFYSEMLEMPCIASPDPFVKVIVDPVAHRKHLAYVPYRKQVSENAKTQHDDIADRLIKGGPDAIDGVEKMLVLEDPMLLCRLHALVWQLPESKFNEEWMSRV